RSRVYDPPGGAFAFVPFADGQARLPPGYSARLKQAMAEVSDKTNVRLKFSGYTANERLERRTAAVYGDDIGLSASRARRVMEIVSDELGLETWEAEFEGRGYVHSADVVNAGFVQGDSSYVKVDVVYDELAVLDDYEGVDITRLTRELKPENPLALNLMRITVDGVPIDDPERSSSDIQRCTDVAMEVADIRFGYDNLTSAPRLSVSSQSPRIIVAREIDAETHVSKVQFRQYTNYSYFIERSEVRVFEAGRSAESEPLAVVPMQADGTAEWQPPAAWFKAPVYELAYVLRAYGEDGNFDETHAQPLWVVYDDEAAIEPMENVDPFEADEAEVLLAGYGENNLGLHNIALGSGTVNVRGDSIPEGHEVWVAGRRVPVDESGSFVTEEVLPDGAHTVEVAVVEPNGDGELYLRDLEFESNDWFYVGMADVTVSDGGAGGAADLLAGDNPAIDPNSNVDGRLAFYLNGKFGEHWRLSASADTREGAISDIFSNFMAKDPTSLFRRIDPDYYYPTFGDDSTVTEMAPTMGKFFVRLSDGDNYGQWGNFKVGYMNNELAQVDRGLYGANVRLQSKTTTEFGDQRYAIDAFGAEPGTVPSRDEFRGTGGSLYYLSRQDILVGSERLRIEMRDKASGIVTGVVNLTPSMDYDIDYLQGRILLATPLASTAEDNLLVRNDAMSGDEAYLVVRYEYTPGFDDVSAISTGGQGHVWLGNYIKLGMTANMNEQDEGDSSLMAADLTLRLSADSWFKVQSSQSEGLVAMPTVSQDGGFEFNSFNANSFVNA
ncbi:MAG: flagellar motor protein MotB, partial [Pseudomonadota bacterium]